LISEFLTPVLASLRKGLRKLVGLVGMLLVCCQETPQLVMTITPSEIKIPDNSKQGAPLAKITVSWSNGVPYHGELRLTKNPGEICQLAGTEIRLGRDTTNADDYTTSVCTVTASE
jgi:hypothetical protein